MFMHHMEPRGMGPGGMGPGGMGPRGMGSRGRGSGFGHMGPPPPRGCGSPMGCGCSLPMIVIALIVLALSGCRF